MKMQVHDVYAHMGVSCVAQEKVCLMHSTLRLCAACGPAEALAGV